MTSALPFLVWLRQQKDRRDVVGQLAEVAIDNREEIATYVKESTDTTKHDCVRTDILEAFESLIAPNGRRYERQLRLLRRSYRRAWNEWRMVLSGQEVIVETSGEVE